MDKFERVLNVLNRGKERDVAKRFSDSDRARVSEVIPCGNYAIDYGVLKLGGLPVGRAVEIFGRESSGKSTLAKYFIRGAQEKNKLCVYFDAEFADQGVSGQEWAKRCGVDVDNMIYVDQGYAEDVLTGAEKAMEEGAGLVVIDSVASLVAKSTAQSDPGGGFRTQKAAILSEMLPRLCRQAYEANALLIFINQIRDLPGVIYGEKFTTPGGWALKFFSSIRLMVDKRQVITEEKIPVGVTCRVKTYKNKTAPPGISAEIPIYFDGRSFTELDWFLETAMSRGIISRPTQSTYIYPDVYGESRSFRGFGKLRQLFLESEDESKLLRDRVLDKGELVDFEAVDLDGD